MSSNTTVFITGANRGIGRGFVTKYLLRENHIVIAAVRDPSSSTSKSLSSLPVGSGSTLIMVRFDASDESSIFGAIDTLKTQHDINSISVAIANAGIAKAYGSVLQTSIQGTRDQYNTNTVGTLALFQAVYPLLLPSPSGALPKFVTISSIVGSIGDLENWPAVSSPYGMSKAALNWLTKNIHIENEGLIAFPIQPGWVQTDMGNEGARHSGLKEAPTTIQESVDGMVDKIDNATREETSGKFISFDDQKYPW